MVGAELHSALLGVVLDPEPLAEFFETLPLFRLLGQKVPTRVSSAHLSFAIVHANPEPLAKLCGTLPPRRVGWSRPAACANASNI